VTVVMGHVYDCNAVCVSCTNCTDSRCDPPIVLSLWPCWCRLFTWHQHNRLTCSLQAVLPVPGAQKDEGSALRGAPRLHGANALQSLTSLASSHTQMHLYGPDTTDQIPQTLHATQRRTHRHSRACRTSPATAGCAASRTPPPAQPARRRPPCAPPRSAPPPASSISKVSTAGAGSKDDGTRDVGVQRVLPCAHHRREGFARREVLNSTNRRCWASLL